MITSVNHMRKELWSKLRLPFVKNGRREKEVTNSVRGKPNVNEEYKEVFRTKSYIEICNKVQSQLETRKNLEQEGKSWFPSSSLSLSSHSSPLIEYHIHLSEYLIEPPKETLISISESSNLGHSLADYFESSLEACHFCEAMLEKIHQVSNNYRLMKNTINVIDERIRGTTSDWANSQCDTLHKDVGSFSFQQNPFSLIAPYKFLELHDSHIHLLHQLTSQRKKTMRRTKFIRFFKKTFATGLIVGCGALEIALFALAMHSLVGMVAAPGLIVFSLSLFVTMKLRKKKSNKTRVDQGLGSLLDVATRGVYMMVNDFNNMGQLVQRLRNEIERMKPLREICVKQGLEEMVKEMIKMHESCFLEKLEELEKHVYLCFLDIKRSRRLIVEEMDKC